MANKKITNEDIFEGNLLVDIIAKANELEAKLKEQLKTFKDLAKNNPFKTGEDLKKFNDTLKEIDASASLLEETQKQNKKATEQLNKELADEATEAKKVKEVLDDVNGTLDQNIKLQTQRANQIKALKKEQSGLNKEFERGRISLTDYNNRTAKLRKEIQTLSTANSKLGFTIKAQIKEGQAASSSFDQQAQRLGQLRSAYRKLSKEQRDNEEVGGRLLKSIKELDKQVKENDASIGNFQRNVGNYKGAIEEALDETDAFGFSFSNLKDTFIGFATNPLTAVTAGLTALGSLYASSTSGARDLRSATTRLSLVTSGYAEKLAKLVGADGKGGGLLDSLARAITFGFGGIGAVIEGEVAVAATNALEELRVAQAQSDALAKKQLDRAEELRQIRDDERKDIQERIQANQALLAQINVREEQQIKVIQDRIEETKTLLRLDKDNNDLKIELIELQTELYDAQEENEGFRSEALTNEMQLEKDLLSIQKERKKLTDEELAKNAKTLRELNADEDDDFFSLDFDAESKALAAQDEEARKRQEKRDKEAEDALAKSLERQQGIRDKAFEEQQKAEEEAAKESQQRLESQLDLATNFASSVGEKFSIISEREGEILDRQAEQTRDNIEKQTRLAEAGLDNQLAFETQKAAEIELKRQEAAEKEERRQKTQLFLESTLQFLKEGSPLEAIGKAAALTVGAGMVAGQFYEGSDLIEKDLGKPHLKGKDGYLVRVDGKERVFSPSQNMKIRQALGNVTNEDLVEMVTRNDSPTLINNFNDKKIVQGLQSVEREIQNIKVELNIDEKGVISQSQFKDGLKRVQKQAKRPRGGINP